jgi:hypothetical protein
MAPSEFYRITAVSLSISHIDPLASVRAGEPLWGCVSKLSVHFEEILSRTQGNFEGHNKVLVSYIIIINYWIIIIIIIISSSSSSSSNAYYN